MSSLAPIIAENNLGNGIIFQLNIYNNILNVYLSILTFSIVEILTNLGRALGAYKMTLDCKDTMTPFYESLGYSKESGNSNTLSIRYPSKPTTKL